jgi:phage terminase large subunit-like protein
MAPEAHIQMDSGDPNFAQSLKEARAATVLSDWRLTHATLMSKLNPWWIPAKWLQYLSLEIARCVAQGNCGLLISAPPRHGKSKLSTVATPLWALENFPHKNVVLATYGEDLSTDFSREIRDTIQNNQDLLNVRLRNDTQRVQNFLTTKGGGLKAVGLRGAITGRGADIFVLDDYIKEPKEALSPTYLEDLWTWWLTVARTRLEPGAVVIILATRWVANDLHGRIEAVQKRTGRNFFKYIRLPALYSPTKPQTESDGRVIQVPDYDARDILGRQYGEVLFPERYNRATILDIKTDLTSRWFEAMFQQNPLSDENVVINLQWFKKITREEMLRRLKDLEARGEVILWGRGWDMASTKEAGDYTSGPRGFYVKGTGEFYIEGMKRGQWSAARAELEFAKAVEEDFALDPDFKIGMEQEPGSSGKYSVRHFEKIARNGLDDENADHYGFKGVKGAKVVEHPAVTSKLLRAQPFLAALEHGKVHVIVDHKDDLLHTDHNEFQTIWVREMFAEMQNFPEGDHDDQVDSVVVLYNQLSGKKGLKASIGRKLGKDITGVDPNNLETALNTKPTHRRGATFGRGRAKVALYRPELVTPAGSRLRRV